MLPRYLAHSVALIMATTLCWLQGWAIAQAPALTLREPRDWQVTQRQTASAGLLHIEGQRPSGARLEWRLSGKPLAGTFDDKFQEIPTAPNSNDFTADLKVPAGGWYQLEMRATREGAVLAEAKIEHVGIGEVFVVAGQSNSANHGSEKQTPKSGLVASFDGQKWQPAQDPQRGADGDGGSFMPAFGDALTATFHVPIGVVPVGVGGTSVREWLPKGEQVERLTTTGAGLKPAGDKWEVVGDLFAKLVDRLTKLGPKGCRAILWHQGESDAGQARNGYPADRQISGEDYVRYMTRLIHASQQAAHWEIPWFNALATYHSENDPSDPEFRSAQHSLWAANLSHEGPDTDALRAEFRTNVHFNGSGLQKHGELWAEKVTPWLTSELKEP
jgi:hypothetical protein